MKICFTLDEVLRAKNKRILEIYQREKDRTYSLNLEEVTTNNLGTVLPFKSQKEFQKFLFEDYPFEIFAEAENTVNRLTSMMCNWHLHLNDDIDEDEEETFEVMLANPYEFNTSIGMTYFYLSQLATRIREVFLPEKSAEIWNRCDVLVTADPKLIGTRPEGKLAIKIETPYNRDCKSDYSYPTVAELFADTDFIDKITGKYNISNKKEEKND